MPAGAASSAGGRQGTTRHPLGHILARCRCSHDGIRGRHGDADPHPGCLAHRRGGPPTPRCPSSRSRTSVCSARSRPTVDRVRVDITPTYSGCPAMDTIRDDVILALTAAGFGEVDVRLVLSPAWTTDWMSDAGKAKLAGLRHRPAVRPRRGVDRSDPARAERAPARGAVPSTPARSSHFGSTSCKALFECRACLEPSTTSRCTDMSLFTSAPASVPARRPPARPLSKARPLPHAHGRGRAPAHRRRGRGHVHGARRARGRVRPPCPDSTSPCARRSTGVEVRRSYSLCRARSTATTGRTRASASQ